MKRSWPGSSPWGLFLGAALRSSLAVAATNLPGQYFELLNTGVARIEKRLATELVADLQALESSGSWKHFLSAILVASVLYTQPHPANSRRGDTKLLSLAHQIGDPLASEHARGRYTTRLDHHRDTYMWLEGYRLLERELSADRRPRWRGALSNLIAALAADVPEKQDFPWYQSPFISTLDLAGLSLQSVSQRPGDRTGPCGGDGLIHTHRKTGTRFCCRNRLISPK